MENYRANDGRLTLHGGIGDGEMVQVCLASPSQLRDEVYKIAQTVQSSGMAPSAALIISCAGRKSLLGGKIDFEVEAIRDACAQPFPMVGFSSFGEIGPLPTRALHAQPVPQHDLRAGAVGAMRWLKPPRAGSVWCIRHQKGLARLP
ncbi:MAG: FIST C-terminal domain-containing protein [Burkholderiales bacterium]|nr:FIST C-terminal domain-containing protein [Burkholderiales bacterium]